GRGARLRRTRRHRPLRRRIAGTKPILFARHARDPASGTEYKRVSLALRQELFVTLDIRRDVAARSRPDSRASQAEAHAIGYARLVAVPAPIALDQAIGLAMACPPSIAATKARELAARGGIARLVLVLFAGRARTTGDALEGAVSTRDDRARAVAAHVGRA